MQHRLSLIQKFMILGSISLVVAALPALLYFLNSFTQQEKAALEKRGSPPLIALNTRTIDGLFAFNAMPCR